MLSQSFSVLTLSETKEEETFSVNLPESTLSETEDTPGQELDQSLEILRKKGLLVEPYATPIHAALNKIIKFKQDSMLYDSEYTDEVEKKGEQLDIENHLANFVQSLINLYQDGVLADVENLCVFIKAANEKLRTIEKAVYEYISGVDSFSLTFIKLHKLKLLEKYRNQYLDYVDCNNQQEFTDILLTLHETNILQGPNGEKLLDTFMQGIGFTLAEHGDTDNVKNEVEVFITLIQSGWLNKDYVCQALYKAFEYDEKYKPECEHRHQLNYIVEAFLELSEKKVITLSNNSSDDAHNERILDTFVRATSGRNADVSDITETIAKCLIRLHAERFFEGPDAEVNCDTFVNTMQLNTIPKRKPLEVTNALVCLYKKGFLVSQNPPLAGVRERLAAGKIHEVYRDACQHLESMKELQSNASPSLTGMFAIEKRAREEEKNQGNVKKVKNSLSL